MSLNSSQSKNKPKANKVKLKKFKVVDLVEKSNNSAAGRKFGVSKKLLQDWWKQSNKIKDLPKTKCADCWCNFLY